MKYIKTRKDLLLVVNPLFFLAGILLFCYCPNIVLSAFNIVWIFPLIALFFIVTPFGSLKLMSAENVTIEKLPWQSFFFGILLLELTLLGVYLGVCFIIGEVMPVNGLFNAHLFALTLQKNSVNFGLFPWSLYACIAIGMGILAYRDNTNAYFSNLLKPFTHQEPDGAWSLIANIGAKRLTLFAVSMMLVMFIFLFMGFFITPATHVASGFKTPALLTTLLLFLGAFSKITRRYTQRIFAKHIPTALSFPIMAILIGGVILIFSIITAGVLPQTAAPNIPPLIQTWMAYNPQTAWLILSTYFWIALTPLVCSFIVRLSKGYQIRSILIAVLILPLLITLYFVFPDFIFLPTLSAAATAVLSTLSFLILLPLLINKKNTPNAIFSYFPKNGVMKPRDVQPFFYRIVQMTVILLYFYLVVGLNGLSLFVFAANFFSVISFSVMAVAVVKRVIT